MRRWTLIAWVILGAAVVFWSVCFPLQSTDIWWHLATGREILAGGKLLFTDPFAAGTQHTQWINLHWLFQLGAVEVHAVGGAAGLVLCKCLLVAAGAAVLIRWGGSGSTGAGALAAVLVALFVHVAHDLVLARPVVITLLMLALYMLALERYRDHGQARALLWLVPLQVLWANTQGGLQLLGPALVLCYFVGDGLASLLSRRQIEILDPPAGAVRWLGLTLLLLLGCTLATPYGLDGLTLPFKLLGRIDPTLGTDLFSLNVSENIPPWLLERAADTPAFVESFKWIALCAFGSFVPLVFSSRRPLVLPRLLVLGGLFALSLTANRNILLFCWIAGPVAALNVAMDLRSTLTTRARVVVVSGLAVGLLAGVAVHRYLGARHEPALAELAPFRVPDRAVEALRRKPHHARGPLFNSVRYGGYMIWTLYPRAYPAIDGRLVLRSAAEFAGHLDLADRPALFEAQRQRFGYRAALLPAAMPDRYLPLVVHLYRNPEWELHYTDGTQALFLRRRARGVELGDRRAVAAIATELRSRFVAPAVREQALLHLARLVAAVGEPGTAAWLLREQALQSHEARSLLCRVLYVDGKPQRAEKLARELLARHGDNVNDLLLLARLALDRDERRRAVDLLDRALEVDPHSRQARLLLARASER
jgi:hypothetical protein